MDQQTRQTLEALVAHVRKPAKPIDVEGLCFEQQRMFIKDPSPFKTACCGARAGKTVGDAVYLHHAAESKPNGVALYLTLSRNNAKKLIWPELLRFNRDGKVNEADLSIKKTNGSFIYASGASHSKEIEKFRGLPLILCIIDEAQSFPAYIQALIDDVVSKRLFDFAGTLALTGTPGPVPNGYFYDACHSPNYKHFAWTMFDNPHIQLKSGMTAQALLEREMARKGVTIDDPVIQRECFGKWTTDYNALVFRFDEARNHFGVLPGYSTPYSYILGIDLGFDDADALAVIGFNEKERAAFLVEEIVAPKQGITELAEVTDRLIKQYNPMKVVMDTGGLGKKIAEELRKRYALPIYPAEKTRKFEFIELLNDALRTGKFFAKKTGRFAQDCMLVEWDRDVVGEKLKISDKFHSDICDAVLYAYRESLHWLYEPEAPIIKPSTPEWFQKQVEEMEQAAQEVQRAKRDAMGEDLDWSWE